MNCARKKPLLRRILLHGLWIVTAVFVVVVVIAIAVFLWFTGSLIGDIPIRRDGPPDQARIEQMATAGYPNILRLFEDNSSSGMTGDGSHLIIHQFESRDWEKMRDAVGQGREWKTESIDPLFRYYLEQANCPKDLMPARDTNPDDFITHSSRRQNSFLIIDRRRGICYSLVLFT